MVGKIERDVASIGDGEFVTVRLDKKEGNPDDHLKTRIYAVNSAPGKAVTVWLNENELMRKLSSALHINERESQKSMNIKIGYVSPKINRLWISYLILILFGLYYFIERIKVSLNSFWLQHKWEVGLFFVGFLLLCFRDLSFLSEPILYAEDASYLSDIMKNGFWKAALSNRNGIENEFKNFGSYVLLQISFMENQLLNGYNIAELPVFIGLNGNLFITGTAYSLYQAFKNYDKRLATAAFLSVIFMPLGNTQAEVMGRVLNTVFLYPVLSFGVLFSRYQRENKSNFWQRIWDFLVIIICGLTFPVSFVVLVLYLFVAGFEQRKDFQAFLRKEFELIIILGMGFALLPAMLQSKGGAQGMEIKWSSTIEFVLARHFLYPLVYPIYHYLKDGIVLLLFGLYALAVVYAYYTEAETQKKYINSFFLLAASSGSVCFSSAIMRFPMTSLFSSYESSFPDRYYYGCNIFSLLLILFSLYAIGKNKQFNFQLNKFVFAFICICLAVNPYLFQFRVANLQSIKEISNFGDFKDGTLLCYQEINQIGETNFQAKVRVYPIVENNLWQIVIPARYVITTAIEATGS